MNLEHRTQMEQPERVKHLETIDPYPAFSHAFGAKILSEAITALDVEFDECLHVGVSPTFFFYMLCVINDFSCSRDGQTDRYGKRWAGAFWFVDRKIQGVGTSKALCYVESVNDDSNRLTFYVDDTVY